MKRPYKKAEATWEQMKTKTKLRSHSLSVLRLQHHKVTQHIIDLGCIKTLIIVMHVMDRFMNWLTGLNIKSSLYWLINLFVYSIYSMITCGAF